MRQDLHTSTISVVSCNLPLLALCFFSKFAQFLEQWNSQRECKESTSIKAQLQVQTKTSLSNLRSIETMKNQTKLIKGNLEIQAAANFVLAAFSRSTKAYTRCSTSQTSDASISSFLQRMKLSRSKLTVTKTSLVIARLSKVLLQAFNKARRQP